MQLKEKAEKMSHKSQKTQKVTDLQ